MDWAERDAAGPVEPAFRTSSFCCSGECVAVAFTTNSVLVRHHRSGSGGPTLEFSFAEFRAFTDAVKAGEFDTPGRAEAP